MENKDNLQKEIQIDKTLETLKDITAKNNEIAEKAVTPILEIIKKNLDDKSDFSLEHGYIALGKAIMYLSQCLCENEDHFKNEVEKSYNIAVHKIMPALQSQPEIVELDQEDYSLRRIMMAISHSVDLVLWTLLAANYSDIRKDIEEQEALEAEENNK